MVVACSDHHSGAYYRGCRTDVVEFLKPAITERIEEATGRTVAIHGDVEISLFPQPQLSLHEFELDNPEWAESPHMLEAQRISVTPSLGDLLQGDMVLEDIAVTGSTLNLEQRAEGSSSWTLGDDEQTNQQTQAEESNASPVDFRNLSVSESEVRYWPAETQTPLDIAISSLQLQADDEALHTQATLTFQQKEFELEAQTDPIAAFLDDAQAFEGNASLSSGDSLLSSTFELPQAPAFDHFKASTELSLNNLAEWSQWLELPQVELESLEIAAQLERQGSEWRLHEIDTAVANSQVTGELTMDTAGETPSLGGQLNSSQLDVAALRPALPESEEQSGLSVPVIPDLRGDVTLSVDRLLLEEAQLQNIQTQVQLAEHSVALEPLTFEMAGGHIEAGINLTSSPERFFADAQITLQNLELAELSSALPAGDVLDADFALELQPLEQRQTFEPDTLLAHLRITDARLAYRNAEAGSNLEATLETSGEAEPPELVLNVDGTFRDKPLTLQARGRH